MNDFRYISIFENYSNSTYTIFILNILILIILIKFIKNIMPITLNPKKLYQEAIEKIRSASCESSRLGKKIQEHRQSLTQNISQNSCLSYWRKENDYNFDINSLLDQNIMKKVIDDIYKSHNGNKSQKNNLDFKKQFVKELYNSKSLGKNDLFKIISHKSLSKYISVNSQFIEQILNLTLSKSTDDNLNAQEIRDIRTTINNNTVRDDHKIIRQNLVKNAGNILTETLGTTIGGATCGGTAGIFGGLEGVVTGAIIGGGLFGTIGFSDGVYRAVVKDRKAILASYEQN